MRTQIRGMRIASRNALDGISLVQVADGALGGVNDMLQRMRDLAVQSANGTLTDLQRANLDREVQQILAEIGQGMCSASISWMRGCLWRTIIACAPMAASVCAVSMRLSPLFTEDAATGTLSTSAHCPSAAIQYAASPS